MKYIVEDKIVFRPDDGAFWMTEREDEKVILPPIVSRLMALLLEEQGKIMTRDEIMERVWTIDGLEPSGNSLNQYISNIRRHFQNVGLGEEVIKTIPRIGFVLSSEIKIEKDIHRPVISEPLSENHHPELIKDIHSGLALRSSSFYALLAVIILVIVCTPFLFKAGINRVNNNNLIIDPVVIGKINQCNVSTLQMENTSHHSDFRALSQRIFDAKNIHCLKDETAFLFVQSSVFYDQPGRVFVSVCDNSNGILVSCKNYSFNNWL
ncbi:winged helix-turn-helix domain-containing protein [Enterobacter chengduensis]|uniref:winged helix-turn-helix domain-containing protein n=1 Tax=Enterobacter chengduensis TaxID=2494701 RepID=UPI003D6E79A3